MRGLPYRPWLAVNDARISTLNYGCDANEGWFAGEDAAPANEPMSPAAETSFSAVLRLVSG